MVPVEDTSSRTNGDEGKSAGTQLPAVEDCGSG